MLQFNGDPFLDRDRLKYVREVIAGVSQQKFSEIIKIPLYKIRDVEIGKTKISVEIALAIEENFLCNFKWILTGSGDAIKKDVVASSMGCDDLTESDRLVELNHLDLVKQFKNKPLAKELNDILKTIEDLDPDHLREVKGLLRMELERVKERYGHAQKTANGE